MSNWDDAVEAAAGVIHSATCACGGDAHPVDIDTASRALTAAGLRDLEAEVENWRKAHDWAHEQWAKKRDAAEGRARRAEDALRELAEAASGLRVAVDIYPERLRPTLRREAEKCRQALDWARGALYAADQASDATPSDGGE